MKTTVCTYEELDRYVQGFCRAEIGLLMIISSPGTGKSQRIKRAAQDARVIEGHMTPIGLYMQAYEARDMPVVLDDIDGLYANQIAVSMLKALCQTDPIKRVTWSSASKVLQEREIPNEFETSSPVCILGNEWHTNNRNVAAIVDRGLCVEFAPNAEEVHREVGTWFDDEEIYAYMGRLLMDVAEPSMRTYIVARQLKRIGQDWRGAIAQSLGVKPALAKVAALLQSDEYATEAERVREFEAFGGSRADYFRKKKELLGRETLRLDSAPRVLAIAPSVV